MANPRQRRKARSSSHQPVKQSRRTNKQLKKHKPIKGSKILQEAWDTKLTVRQNYAALGLAHRLDPTDSGGKDITHLLAGLGTSSSHRSPDTSLDQVAATEQAEVPSSLKPQGQASRVDEHDKVDGTGSLRRGFGRIVRDETGTIVDVILAEEAPAYGGEDAASDSMNEDEGIEEERTKGLEWDHGQEAAWLLRSVEEAADGREDAKARTIVQALEAEASSKGSKATRKTSSAEMKYLNTLEQAYGRDFEAMSKDRKRNVQQYTAGQLRRAFEKAGL